MTLFDALQIIGAIVAAIWIGEYGLSFSWYGGVFGGFIGLIIGYFIGSLPFALSCLMMRYKLKRTSTNKLREQLKKQYYISHLIINELISREEPVEQFRDYVESMIKSENLDKRKFGIYVAEIWFPEMLSIEETQSALSVTTKD